MSRNQFAVLIFVLVAGFIWIGSQDEEAAYIPYQQPVTVEVPNPLTVEDLCRANGGHMGGYMSQTCKLPQPIVEEDN